MLKYTDVTDQSPSNFPKGVSPRPGSKHQMLSEGQHIGCYQTINSDVSFLIFLEHLMHKSRDIEENQFLLVVYSIRAQLKN